MDISGKINMNLCEKKEKTERIKTMKRENKVKQDFLKLNSI